MRNEKKLFQSFKKTFLSCGSVPGILPGTADVAVNEREKSSY